MVGLLSLNESTFTALSEQTQSAWIIPFKSDGSLDTYAKLVFQYYPDSIQDTKQVNWSPREIPGGSLPIYQWISSGERTISFTAYFTSDVNLTDEDAEGLASRLKQLGVSRRNIDIRTPLTRLRSFMLPKYGEKTQQGIPIATAPSKLLLGLQGTGIGATGGVGEEPVSDAGSGQIICVMTQCDISYEAQFPNGVPRIASVSLNFAQVAQYKNTVIYPSNNDAMTEYMYGGSIFHSYVMSDVSAERKKP
jgi:hypothetical protein